MVQDLAGTYGLRCITGHLALGSGASETRAREDRYRWLEETRVREGAKVILTAHHADDQAETVLLRVLHGSGPAGLAGMQERRGAIARPLLGFPRDALEAHAETRGLTWWEDPANRDPRHFRSWLRTHLLPSIRERLRDVDDHLLQVARQAGEDRAAWELVLPQLTSLDWREEPGGASVAAASLAAYDSTLASALLRAVARRAGGRLSRDHAARAVAFLREAASGARLEVGNGWTLHVVFGRAHLLKDSAAPAGAGIIVEGDAGDGELGRWRLFWRHDRAPTIQERDGLTAWFIPQSLAVRPWAAGDKVFPLGGRGRRLVVRCFQDAKVPRHLREGWPMVLDPGGEVVWVPGVCRSNRLVPPQGAEALRVDAQVV